MLSIVGNTASAGSVTLTQVGGVSADPFLWFNGAGAYGITFTGFTLVSGSTGNNYAIAIDYGAYVRMPTVSAGSGPASVLVSGWYGGMSVADARVDAQWAFAATGITGFGVGVSYAAWAEVRGCSVNGVSTASGVSGVEVSFGANALRRSLPVRLRTWRTLRRALRTAT